MRLLRAAIPALVWWSVTQPLHAQRSPILDAVARAMGGKDRVLAVRTLIVEGTGELLFFGQTLTPYAKTMITMTSFQRSLDFANRRWRLDQVRESRYLTPMPSPLRAHFGLDGDVGYNVMGEAAMSRTSATVAADRSAEFVYHPIGFVQAAYDPVNRVTEDMEGDTRRISLSVGAMSFAMHVDRRTNLPTRISRVVDATPADVSP